MEAMAGLSPDVAHGIVENMWSAQTTLTATLALAVGELAEGDTYAADGCRDMTAWLAARFAMSRERAGELVTVGTALRKLPHITAALEDATISWDQARALVRIATPATDEHWAERAVSLSVRQLQREAALANPLDDDDADAAHSRRDDGTYAPYGERRADALVDLCDADLARAQDDDPRYAARRMVTFNTDLHSPEPAIVEFIRNRGVRPVWDVYSHETLRRIACDADTRFAYLNQGKVIFTDARHRGPTPSQLNALWDRDGGCVHPGCSTRCHLHTHHIIHYENGGLTVLSNLVLLCSRHHHYHHEGGGNITGDPYAGLVFHRPDGTIIPNAPPGLDDQIRNAIWN